MKIKLDAIDVGNFMTHDHFLNGEVVTLIQPNHIGTKWTQENKHFRSSLWNADGELISAGFPKFTNYGENPEHFPVPTSLKHCTVVEKLDGSLLILSRYKGNYIMRTRGTVDATKLDNGHEIESFIQEMTNNNLFSHTNDICGDTWNRSYLFEWLSPVNKIVINYGDVPKFTFIGLINHHDYALEDQAVLDAIAEEHALSRPEKYTFSTVTDLLSTIEDWKGKEGVTIYSRNGQMIHKCKSAWYLTLHHLKSELSSIEKVIDVWLEHSMPDYNTFYTYIATVFDFELAEQVRGMISNICDGYKEVSKIVDGMTSFVNTKVKSLSTRREQAELIIGSYGNTNRAAFVFKILDGKPLTKDDYKKLIFQVLKK
jgi:hypothetical protein